MKGVILNYTWLELPIGLLHLIDTPLVFINVTCMWLLVTVLFIFFSYLIKAWNTALTDEQPSMLRGELKMWPHFFSRYHFHI